MCITRICIYLYISHIFVGVTPERKQYDYIRDIQPALSHRVLLDKYRAEKLTRDEELATHVDLPLTDSEEDSCSSEDIAGSSAELDDLTAFTQSTTAGGGASDSTTAGGGVNDSTTAGGGVSDSTTAAGGGAIDSTTAGEGGSSEEDTIRSSVSAMDSSASSVQVIVSKILSIGLHVSTINLFVPNL